MSERTYKRCKKIILNRAKEYYKNSEEKLIEQAKNKYRSLSEEEEDIKDVIKYV